MLPITTWLTVLLGLLFFILTARVILQRMNKRIAFDHGEDKALRGAIRAHMNWVEQAPFFLIAFALAEYRGVWAWWLVLIGVLFLFGRVVNGLGMSQGIHNARVVGTVTNLISLILILGTLIFSLI